MGTRFDEACQGPLTLDDRLVSILIFRMSGEEWENKKLSCYMGNHCAHILAQRQETPQTGDVSKPLRRLGVLLSHV
jgi:hypothetical protein